MGSTIFAGLAGAALGSVCTVLAILVTGMFRRRKKPNYGDMTGVTNMLYVQTIKVSTLCLCVSYGIGAYSTVVYGQVYTMSELSEPIISLLFMALGSKVLANVFEHNNSPIFGRSNGAGKSEVKRDL